MYGNIKKSEWRSSLWRAASEYCSLDDWVLSLAGTRFLDRKEAVKNGFRKDRVIGVDTSKEVEAHNTAHGRTVIRHNLSTVLAAWTRPLSFVNADFCSNAQNKEVGKTILNWLCNPICVAAPMCITVSVGRESGPLLQQLKSSTKYPEIAKQNRAIFAFYYWTITILTSFRETSGYDPSQQVVDWLDNNWGWKFQYRAHRMRMDSYIIGHPGDKYLTDWNCLRDEWMKIKTPEVERAKRSITAKIAWHTMRHDGGATH